MSQYLLGCHDNRWWVCWFFVIFNIERDCEECDFLTKSLTDKLRFYIPSLALTRTRSFSTLDKYSFTSGALAQGSSAALIML